VRGSYEVDPIEEAARSLLRRAEKYVAATLLHGHATEEANGHARSLRQAAVTYAEAVKTAEKARRRRG
jgi:hypothetical protein